jgi:thioredoxin reductase (NADPH)
MSEIPTLDDEDLSILEPLGTRRRVDVGEYLFREGDATYDFYVVLTGSVDISLRDGGQDRRIISHGAGRFLGELNLLIGSRVFLSARVAEPGEVLVVPVEAFRRVIATQPRLSDKILATFMARRSDLLQGAAGATRVIASRYSPGSLELREFLARIRLPYEWLDADTDPQVDELLRQLGVQPAELPVVVASGTVLRKPSPGVLAEYLGLTLGRVPDRCFDLVVVGAGPAGLAASVYGASEGLRTLGLDMVAPGGQAGTSSRIENYFGFPTGISGTDLIGRGFIQAEKFGAQLSAPCAAVALGEEAGHLTVQLSDGTIVAGRAVIAATGARYRRLDVERLSDFEGRGIYYAATDLEARLCAANPVVVVGGGNSAGQAAVFLADQGSDVTVAIRGAALSATMSRYLIDRLEGHPRIQVLTQTQVAGLEGGEQLSAVRLAGPNGEDDLPCAALFSFIGADPTSGWLSGRAALDPRGFVLTGLALASEHLGSEWAVLGRPPLPFETSCPGLFAVGDLRSGSTKRVAGAVGEGSSAVRSVHDHLAFVAQGAA